MREPETVSLLGWHGMPSPWLPRKGRAAHVKARNDCRPGGRNGRRLGTARGRDASQISPPGALREPAEPAPGRKVSRLPALRGVPDAPRPVLCAPHAVQYAYGRSSPGLARAADPDAPVASCAGGGKQSQDPAGPPFPPAALPGSPRDRSSGGLVKQAPRAVAFGRCGECWQRTTGAPLAKAGRGRTRRPKTRL